MAKPRKPGTVYLFWKYTDEELAPKLGYTAHYLARMRRGEVSIGPRFKNYAAFRMGISEEVLFSEIETKRK